MEQRRDSTNWIVNSPSTLQATRQYFANGGTPGCKAGLRFLVVTADGALQPCSMQFQRYTLEERHRMIAEFTANNSLRRVLRLHPLLPRQEFPATPVGKRERLPLHQTGALSRRENQLGFLRACLRSPRLRVEAVAPYFTAATPPPDPETESPMHAAATPTPDTLPRSALPAPPHRRALVFPLTNTSARGTRRKNGTVSDSARGGTSSSRANAPSCTCCMRQTSSSSTARTSRGSSKSQTGGSMNARCPFSPIPMITRHGAAARSRPA